MPAPAPTKAELKALKPCVERWRAVSPNLQDDEPLSFAKLRDCGATFHYLVWVASAMAVESRDVERRLNLYMADCAARVAHIVDDPRVDASIVAARAFVRSEIDDAARDVVWNAAWAVWNAVGTAAWDAEEAWQFDRLIARMSDPEPADWPITKAKTEQE